jgi:protein-disulfide isomerase
MNSALTRHAGDPWCTLRLFTIAAFLSCVPPACLQPAAPPRQPATTRITAPTTGPSAAQSAGGLASAAQATSPQLPVDTHDAVWGNALAPCTIVTFQDLQCPFCGKSWQTLDELERQYGASRLRFVYKHSPLPFHDDALPSARVAQSVFELKGVQAFRDFVSRVFELHGSIDDDRLRSLALSEGVSSKELDALLLDQKSIAWKKLDDDAVLARLLSVQGTPHFFVNGVRVVGAQPIEEFRRVIDQELAAAEALRGSGTKAEDVYAARVKFNFASEPDEERVTGSSHGDAPSDADTTVYRVPVDSQPVEGPNDALVTVVEFVDYQCPFCRRAETTREQLLKKYGNQLRFAIRHNPLPFHPRALPAARLAIEAYKEKGNRAFWQAHRRLLELEELDDANLLAIADSLKLDRRWAKRAIETAAHQDVLDDDEALAIALKASGTPHFFVNGIRVSGAQSLELFSQVIDVQLAKARELAKSGTPATAVYSTLMKKAVAADPFEHKSVPAPTAKNPQRGAAAAPVVIDMFMDFQCPFCSRLLPTLTELERDFPGKLRIVYRSRPLPFHKQARPAAEAALEAFRQRGNAAFWKMFDRLFEVQGTYGALELPELERYAKEQGLDVERFRHALNEHEHEAEIAADESIADREDISGTPACVINGIYVSGAQPVGSFKQAVRAALKRR